MKSPTILKWNEENAGGGHTKEETEKRKKIGSDK